MTKLNKITIASIVIAVIISFALAGCGTTGANNIATPANEQAVILSAAALGTTYALQQTPQDAVYFAAAETVLQNIAGTTNQIDARTIDEALVKSGETNPIVNVAITSAINLANAYIKQSNITNVVHNAALQNAALWISQGISQGLSTVPPIK